MPDSRRLNPGEYHALPAHVHDLKYSIADADGYEELRGFAYKYSDARLFAAAPDLLDALREAVNSGVSWNGISRARAAIAKAGGGK